MYPTLPLAMADAEKIQSEMNIKLIKYASLSGPKPALTKATYPALTSKVIT
jgi:hypothetical protein